MKKIFLIACLLAGYTIAYAQYDSAVRYRMPISFHEAADSLISEAMTGPAPGGEGGEANTLLKWRDFMGSRLCADVATQLGVVFI